MATDAIISSVLAAFDAWGFLNALTPFAMASTPVRALEPEAKARSSTNSVTAPVPAGSGFGATACGGDPSMHSTSPTAISTSIERMKPYVGSAKAMPLSLTPRKFTKVISTIAITHSRTFHPSSPGTAEVIARTPPATDTETVST